MNTLNQKLLAVQQEVGSIAKDSSNPFFKSTYFDINGLLAELKPLLNKHGLVVIQPLTTLGGKLALETTVIEAESGERITSIALLPESSDPQKIGSACTYFRRYSLQSLFLLQAQDDDGNTASPSVPTSHYNAPQSTQSAYTNNSSKPASDKQKEAIKKMANKLGKPQPDAQWYAQLDSKTASAAIGKLKSQLSEGAEFGDNRGYGEPTEDYSR